MQVNIFFVVVSILVLSVLFDINQHKYWMRDMIAATIVSAVLAGFLWWVTGAQRWAALASLFLFLLNTNLEWFFGLYRVRACRGLHACSGPVFGTCDAWCGWCAGQRASQPKDVAHFSGRGGRVRDVRVRHVGDTHGPNSARPVSNVHLLPSGSGGPRSVVRPLPHYWPSVGRYQCCLERYFEVHNTRHGKHCVCAAAHRPAGHCAWLYPPRPSDTCDVPEPATWLASIDLFANSSDEGASVSDAGSGEATRCCSQGEDSNGDGCHIIGGTGTRCKQCSTSERSGRRGRPDVPLFERMDHTARRQYRYASCDTRWHGLSLLDFALLSQAGYAGAAALGARTPAIATTSRTRVTRCRLLCPGTLIPTARSWLSCSRSCSLHGWPLG